MLKEYSPFTPGVPAPLDFFVGRAREIQQFLSAVKKSLDRSSVERLFIIGERGIGKSSICRVALTLAERDLKILGLHVFLGGVDSLEEMVRRIFERLLRESVGKPWHEKVKRFLGDHIKQVDIFGLTIEFSASKRELAQAVSDFIPTMKNLLRHFGDEKKGILLVLDDLNGLAPSPQFANWFKSVVDELATSSAPMPLTFAFAGLPERRQQMAAAQPSLDRVFELIDIQRFHRSETEEFFVKAFGKVGVTVEAEASNLLCRFSGGYPVFMHELGDAVFKIDNSNVVDRKDALAGVLRGAEIIGSKYVEPRILAALRSERYRGILKKIAREPFEHRFTRKEPFSVWVIRKSRSWTISCGAWKYWGRSAKIRNMAPAVTSSPAGYIICFSGFRPPRKHSASSALHGQLRCVGEYSVLLRR